ncbi:PH domain-containing protein [Halomicroarcula sp. GCM10025817]|uniref:PH domain-containing protein n=1 Tax=Haloarcula TaxID=2237 RepID=UPI0023E80E94|nr:PH domain-containing protein [Halomicroarcula sp. SYNS111]
MRRLHPRSAILRVARAAVQGAIFGFFVGTALAGVLGLPAVAVPLLAPLAATLFGGYGLLRYLRFRYEVDDDTLRVESGVVARQSREIPLGRVQNVDTRQGVFNRMLGLTVVEFETAGGSATEATLDAVGVAEADRLRRLVQGYDRRRTDPARAADAADRGETGAADESPGVAAELLFTFSWRDLLTYAVVSVRPAAPVLTLVGLPLGSDVVVAVLRFNLRLLAANGSLGIPMLRDMATPRLVVLAVLTGVQFVLVALVVSAVLTVVEYYQFTLTREDDDLRYERGLLRRYSGTIPVGKVQTVSIRENALMRRFGYATLVVETAGYGPQSQQSSQGVAVPMAPREDVYELARDVAPFGDLAFERPPKRARRRYAFRYGFVATVLVVVGYAVDTFVLESGRWWVLLGLFAVVVPGAYYHWIHRGYALDDDVLATRTGFWRRTTRVVPYYRIQTVFVRRTPFQRRRRLATVTADTASSSSLVGGSASAYDVDADVAGDLRDELRERLRTDLLERKAAARARAPVDEAPAETTSAADESSGSETGADDWPDDEWGPLTEGTDDATEGADEADEDEPDAEEPDTADPKTRDGDSPDE